MKTVTITRFPLPEGISLEALKKDFEAVSPRFAQVPGLLQKTFVVSEDLRHAGGVYVWESLEQARSFSESTLKEMIRKRFAVRCEVEYFHAPLTVAGPASPGQNAAAP